MHLPVHRIRPAGSHSRRCAKAVVAVVTASSLVLSACSSGQREYPSKKMELLVAFDAGSAPDTVARAFAASLEEVAGNTVLVVNKPGAGGILGTTEAMVAAPDGYNLSLAGITSFTSAPLMQDVKYSAEDFRSVIGVAEQPFAVSTSADSGIKSIEDLKTLGRPVTFGILGIGHASQVLLAEILKQQGVEGRAVPFNGSSAVVQAAISGEIDIAVTDANTPIPRIENNELTPLAITGQERLPSLPDVPTVTELGYPEADYTVSQALVVPAGIEEETYEKLQELSREAVQSESYQTFLEDTNTRLTAVDGDAWMTEYVPAEKNDLAAAYEELGIEP